MTEIILARHGQTAWNTGGEVFRGRTDVPLDETGLKQAEMLADYLKERKVGAVYSGPLQRALTTARTIAGCHDSLEVNVTHSLNDISFGEWEGMPFAEVRTVYKTLYNQWVAEPATVKLPGGECIDDITRRAMPFVNEIVDKYPETTVILVSHRVVLQALILAMLGLDNSHFWNLHLDTASITTFTTSPFGFILKEHNNTCYLK